MIWWILFFGGIFIILHSYVIFPLLLEIFNLKKKTVNDFYGQDDAALPDITIVLAAYNEELVIEKKVRSTFDTTYPLNKIRMLIGSDASTDSTNNILEGLANQFQNIEWTDFPGRSGKAAIINTLTAKAESGIIILTDANVFFGKETIYHLVKHFKRAEIALVGGHIVNYGIREDGISRQEKAYLLRENRIKYLEGLLWGTMIGAFGGCYAIRKEFYAPVPPAFFMDDFYITMNVLEKRGKCIHENEAVCFEDVSNKISEEFRRKVRISIGNYQNLNHYFGLLFSPARGLSFSFWSHKVFRWLSPFVLILLIISNIFLLDEGPFFKVTLAMQIVLMGVPILDAVLRKLKVHITLLRFTSHFYLMNLALLVGFFRYMAGVSSNVWQPTQRFQ